MVTHNPLFFLEKRGDNDLSIEGYVALDRNMGPGYNTLLLRLIPRDLISAFAHRHFHTLPSLFSRPALSNYYPNACMPSRKAVCSNFMMVFGMTQSGNEPNAREVDTLTNKQFTMR